MLQFKKREVTVGRSPSNDVVLHGGKVSKLHATIAFDPTQNVHRVVDHESTNGVAVNGVRVKDEQVLAPGDKIDIGGCTIEVAIDRSLRAEKKSGEGDRRSRRRRTPARREPPQVGDAFGPVARVKPASSTKLFAAPAGGAVEPEVKKPEPARSQEEYFEDFDEIPADRKKRARPSRGSPGSAAADPALVEFLRRYVEWDEAHRTAIYGEPCTCGSCLLCESRALLGSAD